MDCDAGGIVGDAARGRFCGSRRHACYGIFDLGHAGRALAQGVSRADKKP